MADQYDGSVKIDTSIDEEPLTKAINRLLGLFDDFSKTSSNEVKGIDKAFEEVAKNAANTRIEPTTDGIKEAQNELKQLDSQIDTQREVVKKCSQEWESYANFLDRAAKPGLESKVRGESTELGNLSKKLDDAKGKLQKMAEHSADLGDAIEDAKQEMQSGGSEAKELGDKAEVSGGKLEKAGGSSTAFQHALGDLISSGIQKAISALAALDEKTKEYRQDMSKLGQNAIDAGVSMDIINQKSQELYAITGETDSNVEALSNLLAAGFDNEGLSQAVDALSGAVIKFPDTMKIESLADSLQETLATGEATGQFAELLERLGIDAEKYSGHLSRMSEEGRKNRIVVTLQTSGLAEINKRYRENNKDLIANANAQYALNQSYSEFGAVVEPIKTKLMAELSNVLKDNKDSIVDIIQAVGQILDIGARALGVISKIPGPVLLISAAILGVSVAIGKFVLSTYMANTAIAGGTKALASAGPMALQAGTQFALLAVEILAVGTAIALVTLSIAALISSIRGIPMIMVNSNMINGAQIENMELPHRQYATGTASASRGLALVGERGPELVNFSGGEQILNAARSHPVIDRMAATQGAERMGTINYNYTFKVDDIATYARIEQRMKNERRFTRMGYVGR